MMPRRTDTKQRIERIALGLFAAKGVDATTTKDIAAGVGISEGAIYRHFTGKDALVWHLFSTNYVELAGHIDEILEAHEDLDRRIDLSVDLFCDMFDRDPELFRFILLSQHGQLGKVTPEMLNPMDSLARLFQDGIESGACPSHDANLLAGIALGIVLQPATFIIYGRLAGPLSAHSSTLAAAVWKAVTR
jgi:AcrR family transcriptional regulator